MDVAKSVVGVAGRPASLGRDRGAGTVGLLCRLAPLDTFRDLVRTGAAHVDKLSFMRAYSSFLCGWVHLETGAASLDLP